MIQCNSFGGEYIILTKALYFFYLFSITFCKKIIRYLNYIVNIKKTIDYANKEYLRNARGGNSRGNLYEDNNARKADENLQQTDEGRQTPRFRQKDGGEPTEGKRNVQEK